MIEGVMVKQLKVIPDERGRLMEILRCDEEMFEKFGQVYLTTGYPGVVKAWHYHKGQTDHFCVVKGMMKVVLYDSRAGSRSPTSSGSIRTTTTSPTPGTGRTDEGERGAAPRRRGCGVHRIELHPVHPGGP